MSFWLPLLIGAGAGVLSGWGVGGGSLLLIYLANFTKIPQAEAQGINLLFFLPAAAGALFFHIRRKAVDWKVFFCAALPGLAAAIAASFLATAQNDRFLRTLFGWFLILTGGVQLFASFSKKK